MFRSFLIAVATIVAPAGPSDAEPAGEERRPTPTRVGHTLVLPIAVPGGVVWLDSDGPWLLEDDASEPRKVTDDLYWAERGDATARVETVVDLGPDYGDVIWAQPRPGGVVAMRGDERAMQFGAAAEIWLIPVK